MQHDHILKKLILYCEGHFWPQGRNLNKFGRVPQGDLHIKYQDSRPCGIRQEDFLMFSYLAYVNHVNPVTGPFWLKGHNLNKYGRDL